MTTRKLFHPLLDRLTARIFLAFSDLMPSAIDVRVEFPYTGLTKTGVRSWWSGCDWVILLSTATHPHQTVVIHKGSLGQDADPFGSPHLDWVESSLLRRLVEIVREEGPWNSELAQQLGEALSGELSEVQLDYENKGTYFVTSGGVWWCEHHYTVPAQTLRVVF